MENRVFHDTVLAGIPMQNRIIRSATHEGMANPDGSPSDQLKSLYLKLARGGVGMIISGYAGISQVGKSSLYRMMMIDRDDLIPRYREICEAVHLHGTAIVMQIAHCGRQTRSAITGMPTVAPSAIRDRFYNETVPLELSETEIDGIIDDFVDAIVRVKKAGFDGVQLHMAHGYLLAQFLSPGSNRRKDRWGGSLENRYRIIDEIFKRAKDRVGTFPILVKLNAYDRRRRGMRIEEAVQLSRKLEMSGCAAIEVSCGTFEDGFLTIRGNKPPIDPAMSYIFKYKRLPAWIKKMAKPILKALIGMPKPMYRYNLSAATEIRKHVNLPLIVVGGNHRLADINEIVCLGDCYHVSMSRPFIIETDIVNKIKLGKSTSSNCIMCNYCMIVGEEKPLKCYYGRMPKTKMENK